jgi:hypothetical protein
MKTHVTVAIATGYGVDAGEVGIRAKVAQQFSLLHMIQNGAGIQKASYPKNAGVLFWMVKRMGYEYDHIRLVPRVLSSLPHAFHGVVFN